MHSFIVSARGFEPFFAFNEREIVLLALLWLTEGRIARNTTLAAGSQTKLQLDCLSVQVSLDVNYLQEMTKQQKPQNQTVEDFQRRCVLRAVRPRVSYSDTKRTIPRS